MRVHWDNSIKREKPSLNEKLALQDLRSKCEEYKEFVEKTLQPQFRIAISLKEETESEIKEYNELKANLVIIELKQLNEKKELESLVDLGHNQCFARAIVDNPNKVFVHVGLGFHVEFKLEEAIRFIDKRLIHLRKDVLSQRIEKSKSIEHDLKDALALIESLQNEFRKSG